MRLPALLSPSAVLAAAIALASPAAAQNLPGVSETEIRIGNTLPYTGPAAAYGALGRTFDAYFAMINAAGGVNGRMIRFISYDDGFSPPVTLEQTRRLVEEDDVLLIFQQVGTNPSLAVRDYLNAAGVPQLFASSGSPLLDDPAAYPWTMRWNPSFEAEGIVYARYVAENFPGAKVGILYRNDEAGIGYVAAMRAQLPAGTPIIALPYDVNDPTVDAQIAAFQADGVEVFLDFAIATAASRAIARAAELGWTPHHILTSAATGADILAAAGPGNAVGIVSAIFMKDPDLPEWAADEDIAAYRTFLAEHFPEGAAAGLYALAAYSAAGTLVDILRAAGDDLSRSHIMALAANLDEMPAAGLLPGIALDTDPTDYAPLEEFQLARFDGTAFVPFGPILTGAP
ncbi:MAG: ABC transporter substrate-binding protein [Bauldia sp.]|nr:ABC transporter substrate-binding protein [Bauldia sp.]